MERKVEQAISRLPEEPSQIDEIAEIRKWFRPEKKTLFYGTIQEYLAGIVGLEETVAKLSIPIDAAVSKNSIGDIQWDFGYSVLHSAKRTSFRNEREHEKLVNLMKEMKSRSKGDSDDLYRFGWAAREAWNDRPGTGAGYSVPEIHAYSNVNYFLARLTKEGIIEFWTYVIYAMRPGLEETHTDDGPNDAHVPGTAVQKIDAYVPAAAVWVFALGTDLYEREEDLTPTSPNHGDPAQGGDRWKGKSEFSKARWSLWKQRFAEVSELQEVAAETRHIAKEANETMNRCERC